MRRRQGFCPAGLMLLLAGLMVGGSAQAEDEVVTQSQVFRGKVKAATTTGVTIEIAGRGEVTIPRAAVVKLTVEPPSSVVAGLKDYEKGKFREARLSLVKVLTQYQGLDVDWVMKGLAYYARACLLCGDYENAEKGYQAFLKAYADEPLAIDAAIGLMEIEVAKKNYETALTNLQELAVSYDNQVKPAASQLPYAARIYLTIGKCQEAVSSPGEALNAYLRVAALYPADQVCPEALYRGALIYISQKQYDKADGLLTDLIDGYGTSEFTKKAADEKKNISMYLTKAAAPTAEKPPAP